MVVHIKLLGKLRKPHLDADVVRFGSLSIYNSHGLAIAMAWVWLWPGCGLAVAMASKLHCALRELIRSTIEI